MHQRTTKNLIFDNILFENKTYTQDEIIRGGNIQGRKTITIQKVFYRTKISQEYKKQRYNTIINIIARKFGQSKKETVKLLATEINFQRRAADELRIKRLINSRIRKL